MKPLELYTGPAPGAMSQMGQGIADAGARIGQIYQQGYQNAGQGIAKGIEGAANAYEDYKKMSSQVKADANAFESLKSYMPKEVADKFDSQRKALDQDPNASLRDKQAFYNAAKSFLGSSIQHKMDMDRLDAQLQVTKGIGLGNILAPYVFGTKGTNPNPAAFIDPSFGKPSQSTAPTGSNDEVTAFLSEQPNGNAEDFAAWQQERAAIRAAQAKKASSSFDATLPLPR